VAEGGAKTPTHQSVQSNLTKTYTAAHPNTPHARNPRKKKDEITFWAPFSLYIRCEKEVSTTGAELGTKSLGQNKMKQKLRILCGKWKHLGSTGYDSLICAQ